jgi:hypothetical protein
MYHWMSWYTVQEEFGGDKGQDREHQLPSGEQEGGRGCSGLLEQIHFPCLTLRGRYIQDSKLWGRWGLSKVSLRPAAADHLPHPFWRGICLEANVLGLALPIDPDSPLVTCCVPVRYLALVPEQQVSIAGRGGLPWQKPPQDTSLMVTSRGHCYVCPRQ